jgi:Cu(I)/Ag(I) efflux system membrane fusion protein
MIFLTSLVNTKVSLFNPEINPDTRLVLVRMRIENKNLQLKPGMQGRGKYNSDP